MKRFLILITILSCFLTQADAIGVKSTMQKIMESWIGENIHTVKKYWGVPDEEKNIANQTLYYWYRNGTMTTPIHANSYVNTYSTYSTVNTNIYGGNTIALSCTRILGVDKEGYVNYWEWKGNNCPFALAMGYQNWVNPSYLNQKENIKRQQKAIQKNSSDEEYKQTIERTKNLIDSLNNQ